jgi:hypothetical protein
MNEMWIDFETWLEKHTNYKVSDLSWNAYVLFSKEYNSQRLDKRFKSLEIDFDTTKIRHGLERNS